MKVQKMLLLLLTIFTLLCWGCTSKETKAFDFLSSNRKWHVYIESTLVDSIGNKVHFSPYHYSSLYAARDTLDLLKTFNTLYEQTVSDSEIVSPDFIRNHAKQMLLEWRNSSNYATLSWEDFCEYWLPYRADGEKLSDCYPILTKKYANIRDSLTKGMSVIAATNLLESNLKSWLKFDLRDHASLNRPSILETLKTKKGGCNTRTEFTCQALRAIGIVATIDECPVWGHRNSGHQWNVIRTPNGEWLPFNGAENLIGTFPSINDSVKAPKIYRKQFSPNLSFAPPTAKENIPPVFYNNRRKDVTSEYVKTKNVTIHPTVLRKDSILYLSVFNDKVWKIVSWTTLKNGIAEFTSMGCNNIVYLPVYYHRHALLPAGAPFILHKDGSKTELIVNDVERLSRDLLYTNVMFDSKWMKGSASIGEQLELYYWKDAWILCDTCVMGKDKILHFNQVPSGGLYLIKGKKWDNTWQRIFTLNGNEQHWY